MSKYELLETILTGNPDTTEQLLRKHLPTRKSLTAWLRGIDYAFPVRGLTTDQIYQRAALELRSGSAAFLDA